MNERFWSAMALAAATMATPATAQTTFTSRAAFNAAAGATSTVTFNSYTTVTPFRTAPVDVGPFSLVGAGSRQDDRNTIDTPPGIFGGYFSVDGSSYVQGQVGGFANGTSSFQILFDAPTFAFGADFADLNDLPGITQITINGTNYVPGSLASFFGYVSTTAFTSVSFTSTSPGGPNAIDNFGMDNVTFSAPVSPGVPEPAAWAMMIGGFGAVGAAMRRRQGLRTANA